jgi:hypothetical protein
MEDQFNRRLKGNLEESIRSSRTATFKSMRGTNVTVNSVQNNKALKQEAPEDYYTVSNNNS